MTPGSSTAPDPMTPEVAAPTRPPPPGTGRTGADAGRTGAEAGRTGADAGRSGADVAPAGTAPAPTTASRGISVPGVLGGGGILAAGLVGLIVALRRSRSRRRAPGERPPGPRRLLGLEPALLSVAELDLALLVDRAVRSLGRAYREGGELPQLRAVRVTTRQVELYLATPADLSAPWTPLADGLVWAAAHDDLDDPGGGDDRMPTPFPTLAGLGVDQDGAHVLLNLEEVKSLAIGGEAEDVEATLVALTLDLATSGRADDLQVSVLGDVPPLDPVVRNGRMRRVEDADRLVAELEERALEIAALLEEEGLTGVAEARALGVASDAWTPEVVILGSELTPALQLRLEAVLSSDHAALVVLTRGDAAFGAWRFDQEGADRARLEPTGIDLAPPRIPAEELRAIMDLVERASADPVPDPDGWWTAPGGAPSPGAATTETVTRAGAPGTALDDGPLAVVRHLPNRAPRITVLGPPTVHGCIGEPPSSAPTDADPREAAVELLVFLAFHRSGATLADIAVALDPSRRPELERVAALVADTRVWLGHRPDGTPWLPRVDVDGLLRLPADVRTDWDDVTDLIGASRATAGDLNLEAAVRLLGGTPLAEIPLDRWTWAVHLREDLSAAAADLCHEAADRAIRRGDAAAARRAAAAGRRIEPDNEVIWRDALRAEYLADDAEEQARLTRQLLERTEGLEVDLDPVTEDLLQDLAGGAGR